MSEPRPGFERNEAKPCLSRQHCPGVEYGEGVGDYLRADQRRARARSAAVHLLQDGTELDALTLRQVAQAMGTSTSTLTYVYPTIGALLDDLAHEHAVNMWQAMVTQVGNAGLYEELSAVLRRYFLYGIGDRARSALIRYSIRSVVSDRRLPKEVDPAEDLRLVAAISHRAGEHYRVPDATIMALLDSMIYGLTMAWVATGDEEGWWEAATAGVEAITLLADPRPIGVPHAPYRPPPVPDRNAEWNPLFHAYSVESQPRDSAVASALSEGNIAPAPADA